MDWQPVCGIYRSFRPDAVLGMGGFTSTGPILAGRIAGLPTFIHESNAIPGKANRLNALLSKKVLLGFEECARCFPNEASRSDRHADPRQFDESGRSQPGVEESALEERACGPSW